MRKAPSAETQRAARILAARRRRAVEENPVVAEIEACTTLQSVQSALGQAGRYESAHWAPQYARAAPPPWLLPPTA